ncbi:hypothetical protein A3H90_03090 [Candidatus Peribacteria bacterium RIFCSPLOWO2_02_FULL_55_36]|nr:MAG: hypothetical protein A3H90_03090 [Candidatus Peribacteria bacterium RIFCSPLOWO2_02_FULL_55_36]
MVRCDGFVMVRCEGFVMVRCEGFVMVRCEGFVMVRCEGFVMVRCEGFVMVRDFCFAKIVSNHHARIPQGDTLFLVYRTLLPANSGNRSYSPLISASFFFLLHFFRCFSHEIASRTSWNRVLYTHSTGRRRNV